MWVYYNAQKCYVCVKAEILGLVVEIASSETETLSHTQVHRVIYTHAYTYIHVQKKHFIHKHKYKHIDIFTYVTRTLV